MSALYVPSIMRQCVSYRSSLLRHTLRAPFHRTSFQFDIIKIQDEADFMEKVLKNDKLVIVDFFANWCGPCKIMGPRLELLVGSSDTADHVDLAMVDVDKVESVASLYSVSIIPAVFAVKGGQVIDQFVGQRDMDQLKSFISRARKS